MTIIELKAQRIRIEDRLKKYYKKHYDGRALLEAYQNITKILQDAGRGVGFINHDHTSPNYWAMESSRNREKFNKNPIIGVDENFEFIWKNGAPAGSRRARQNKNIQPNILKTDTKESKISQNKYYRINIEWDSNTSSSVIDFVLRFFDDMGLEPLSSTHYGRSFRFDGTDEGLRLLKRAAMVSLDILSESPINIGIYSEIIT